MWNSAWINLVSRMKAGMTIRKITVLISAVCLYAYIGSYLGYKFVTAGPPGYCRAQQRYITDEEFLKVTVAMFERYRNEEWVNPDRKRVRREDSSDWQRKVDFDPTNPNCCFVDRDETHSVLDRMFGWQEVVVWLNLRTSTLPVVPTDEPIRSYFDVCGNLKHSDIGRLF
jgi:hypothetical protein